MEDYKVESEMPNILFLSGIDIKEYVSIEDKANEKFMQRSDLDNSLNEYPLYSKNGVNFLSNEKWATKTNLHCWYCDFTSSDRDSIFIPIYIKECITGELEFGVRGHMCSFNCAMSVILSITSSNSPERWKYINNLKILYFIKNGKFISDIKPSPNKYNLQKYGGAWSNEKFLEELQKLNVCKGLKEYNLENAISEREKIIAVVRNIIDTNKKTTRVIREDESEDDCVIYRGNRIALGKKSIWALNYNASEDDTLNSTASSTTLSSNEYSTALSSTALSSNEYSTASENVLSSSKLEDAVISLEECIEKIGDPFDFNQFLLDEIFSE